MSNDQTMQEMLADDTTEAPMTTAELFAALALMTEQEAALKDAEEALDHAKRTLQHTQRNVLPDMMIQTGITSLNMQDGRKVAVANKLHVSLPREAAERQEAFDYLEAQGAGPLIKDELKVAFDKGQHNIALATKADMQAKGLNAELQKAVHWASLNKFAKERIESGQPLDEDQLNIHTYQEVKITGKRNNG